MKIETIGKHRIELYGSIEELPVDRYSVFNRMLLIDSGLGSDFEAVDSHITQALQYVVNGQAEEARQALINMRNSFYFITENLQPKYLAYAALVHSIDGHLVTDFSDDNLERLVKQFSQWGASVGYLDRVIAAVKKKLRRN